MRNGEEIEGRYSMPRIRRGMPWDVTLHDCAHDRKKAGGVSGGL